MFEVIRCGLCGQHFGRKSGSASARCPHCSTRSGTDAKVTALVERGRDLHEKVAELNLPAVLRGRVPTVHPGSTDEAVRRLGKEKRVLKALKEAGASGRFDRTALATALAELEVSANPDHVIVQAMEAGLLIQAGVGEWELIRG